MTAYCDTVTETFSIAHKVRPKDLKTIFRSYPRVHESSTKKLKQKCWTESVDSKEIIFRESVRHIDELTESRLRTGKAGLIICAIGQLPRGPQLLKGPGQWGQKQNIWLSLAYMLNCLPEPLGCTYTVYALFRISCLSCWVVMWHVVFCFKRS